MRTERMTGAQPTGWTVPGLRVLRIQQADSAARVGGLEILFDIVAAYSMCQIDTLILADQTSHGVLRGLLILGVIWGAWTNYVSASNALRPDHGVMRPLQLTAMGGLIGLGLALPNAFNDTPGTHAAATVFVTSYLLVRAIAAFMLLLAGGGIWTPRLTLVLTSTGITASIMLASTQLEREQQTWAWFLALIVDLTATIAFNWRWKITSATHLADRYGLILIMGVDDSIALMASGMLDKPVTAAQIILTAATVLAGISIWWLYFNRLASLAEHRLSAAEPKEQTRLTGIYYTGMHLLLMMGLLVLSLGLRTTSVDIYEPGSGALGLPLSTFAVISLCAGMSLYLIGLAIMWFIVDQQPRIPLIAAAVLVFTLVPVAPLLPSLTLLLVLDGVFIAMVLTDLNAQPTRPTVPKPTAPSEA